MEVEKGYTVELWYYVLPPNPIFFDNLNYFSETMDMFDFNECIKLSYVDSNRKERTEMNRKEWGKYQGTGYKRVL